MVVILITLLAAIFDCRWRVIPNWLTYPFIVSGFVFAITGVGVGLVDSILGFFAISVWAMIAYRLGAIGGGDLKLLAGYGSVLGLIGGLQFLAVALVFVSIYHLGIVTLQLCGRFNRSLNALMESETPFHTPIRSDKGALARLTGFQTKIPFALPVFLATLWVELGLLDAFFLRGFQ